MSSGYLSRDRAHLATLQRKRRARMVRIDYMPGPDALAAIEAKRAPLPDRGELSTNSAIIDAIVTEWAELTGIDIGEAEPAKSPEKVPDLADMYAQARMSPEAERSARAQESGEPSGITPRIAGARRHAYESGQLTALQRDGLPSWAGEHLARQARRKTTGRVTCGAKRHRDGQPCQAKSEPGKRRCRFHGGRSTGPRTPEGKTRALANLRQYRKPR